MYSSALKKEIEIFFKSNNTNLADTARKFGIPYSTLKGWAKDGQWEAGVACKDLQTKNEEIVKENFNIITRKAQDRIKQEIIDNLGAVAYDVDNIVLNSLMQEASEAALIQAMSLNHINKSLALNASIAKNALLELNATSDGSMQSKMAIIACSEKVSKIFGDLKTSLYGSEIKITQNVNNDLSEASDAELLEIINKDEFNS